MQATNPWSSNYVTPQEKIINVASDTILAMQPYNEIVQLSMKLDPGVTISELVIGQLIITSRMQTVQDVGSKLPVSPARPIVSNVTLDFKS